MKAEKLVNGVKKAGELKIRRSKQTAIKTFVLHIACVVWWWRGEKSFH